MPHIPPNKLEPCPKCQMDMVYIPSGTDKFIPGKTYEAYYKCPNDCRVEHAGRMYPVKFLASKANKHLKS